MSLNQPPHQNKNETNRVPEAYDHSNYKLSMSFLPDGSLPESKHYQAAWCVMLSLEFHDFPKFMREGLWWSCANIVPELGFFQRADPRNTTGRYTHARHWTLREYPEKEEAELQWHGLLKLSAKSYSILTEFSLGQLTRENIYMCTAFNRQGEWIFHRKPSCQEPAINCFYDGLHPGNGSWWIFPMDRLVPAAQDPEVVDEAHDGPVRYADKPDDGCTCGEKKSQQLNITGGMESNI